MKKEKQTLIVNENLKKTPLREENHFPYKYSNHLKNLVVVFSIAQIVLTSTSLYLSYRNKEQVITNDFNVDKVIDNNGNEIEIDENGQIDPYPVSDEEKKSIINQFYQFLDKETLNFGLLYPVDKIISIDSIQVRDNIIENSFKNYLLTIKLQIVNENNNKLYYELQYYADKDFSLTTSDQSNLNKLNEIINYLQDPNCCALYNLVEMNEQSTMILEILKERGNKNIIWVGPSIKTQHNSGDTLYLIPIYYSDGKIETWTTSIQSTKDLEFIYGSWYEDQSAPEKAFLDQLNGKQEFFTKTEKTLNSNLNEINTILKDYQDPKNSETETSNDNETTNERMNKTIIQNNKIKKFIFETVYEDEK